MKASSSQPVSLVGDITIEVNGPKVAVKTTLPMPLVAQILTQVGAKVVAEVLNRPSTPSQVMAPPKGLYVVGGPPHA